MMRLNRPLNINAPARGHNLESKMYKEIIELGEAATHSDRQEYLKQDQIGMGALWAESYLIARGYDLCLIERPDQWEIATESLRYAIESL
jgi:hypothetical protein